MASEDNSGLPREGTQVGMSWMGREEIQWSTGDEALWTTLMGDCLTVATFDRETQRRSICHLQGGNGSNKYYAELARGISEQTDIIFACGTDTGAVMFRDFCADMEEKIKFECLTGVPEKSIENLVFHQFRPESEDEAHDPGSVVILGDGRYGRAVKA